MSETGFRWQVGQTLTAEDVAEMERSVIARNKDISRLHRKLDGRGDLIRKHVCAVLGQPDLEIDGERLDYMLGVAEHDLESWKTIARERKPSEERAEIERLTGIIHDDNAVCICGCPPDDHEQYPEGEACKDETHECLRVSHGVKKIVDKLRLDVEVAEAIARPGQPLPCGHPQRLAFTYDHHGKKIDCLMCLVVRLTDAVKPLAAFSTADMVQVSAGRNIITGADAQIAARTVKDSKAAQAFYAKRVVDDPTPECGTSPPCTGCDDLEDRLVKMRIEWGEEQRELEEKSQIIDIVLNGLGVDAGDWDQSPKAAEDLVKAVLRYIAGEEDVWNGQEPGGSVVLAVHDRFKELKARIADLELALKDDANLRAFCDKEVIRENGELKRRVVALETTEHGLQDRLASADDALADLKTRLAEVEANTNGYQSAARFRDKLEVAEVRIERLEAKVRGHLMITQINARIRMAAEDATGNSVVGLYKSGDEYPLDELGADMRSALAWFKQGHGATLEDQE